MSATDFGESVITGVDLVGAAECGDDGRRQITPGVDIIDPWFKLLAFGTEHGRGMGPSTYRNLRLLALAALCLATTGGALAADKGGLRDYFTLRGGTTYFTNPGASADVELDNPALEGFQGGEIGLNLDRHWGVELAAGFIETALMQPGTGEKIAEYGLWTILAQARLRFPMWNDRLTPYFVVGAGVGIGEQNDRNFLNAGGIPGRTAIPLNGPSDTTFVAALGAGIEYFLTDNIALGVEAKHFIAETEAEYAGQPAPLDFQSLVGTIGLRVYLDKPSKDPDGRLRAADSDRLRGYLALRAGAAFFTDPDSVPQALIGTPVFFGGAAFGLNFNRHWGAEFVAEGLPGRLEASLMETALTTSGEGEVVEYSVWTNILQLRARYPMLDDRLVPYAVFGGGVGYGEFNDRRIPAGENGVTGDFDVALVGSAGVGLEYFIANDIALGVEAKHVFMFETEATVNQKPAKLTLDPVFFNLSLRIFF